jgi:peptidyl-prolyl cis-trans isomerase C
MTNAVERSAIMCGMVRQVARTTLACFAAALIPAASAAQTSQTLATVGAQQISVDEFRLLMREMRRAGNTETTLETLTAAGRAQLLTALIEKDLYAVGAREAGLDREPEVKFWLDQAVTEVLAKKYLEAKAAAVVVTDAALKEFYDQHRDRFATPSQIRVRHIVLKSREEADAVLAEAKAGKDFARLAEERSEDTGTRAKGGDLGWVPRGLMVQPFEDVIFSLKKGEIGAVVQTRLGYHVVKVEDIQDPKLPPFDAIRSLVMEKKIATELEALKAQLAARHPVQIQREVLESLGP